MPSDTAIGIGSAIAITVLIFIGLNSCMDDHNKWKVRHEKESQIRYEFWCERYPDHNLDFETWKVLMNHGDLPK